MSGMLRRAWKPAALIAFGVATPAYLYNRYSSRSKPQTFDVSIKETGPDGKALMVTKTFPLQSMSDIDQRINQHASLETKPAAQGLVWKHTTAHLSSNDPIEDANSHSVIAKEHTSLSPAGQLLFFAVMDGHGGWHTSQLLSNVLIPAVALELSTLIANGKAPISKSSMLDSVKTLFSKSGPTIPLDADPKFVSQAIERAFLNLDTQIVNAPLHVLVDNTDRTALEKRDIPDLSQHPLGMATMLPAMSGKGQ